MIRLFRFLRSELGAITVDWVVLTAAVASLGILVLTSVSSGTGEVTGKVSDYLSSTTVESHF